MDWISVKDKLPKENETVWMFSIKHNWVYLGCRMYEDGWIWAESDGCVYMQKGKITADCVPEDDYDISHWHPLPKPPQQ